MCLVTSFLMFLQPLAVVMSARSFANLTTILTGWTFASHHTLSQMIGWAGMAQAKHYSAFYRLFASARWSRDMLGLAVLGQIEPWLADGPIRLALDDTLARKRGLKVFGVGMHHDPLLSTRKTAIMNWGHSWVVLGVLVEFSLWRGRVFCLPILFRLYLNRKSATRDSQTYRTRPELAVELLRLLCGWRKQRRFHLFADSAYGGQSVLKQLPDNCDLTSRLVLDARLYDAAPPRQPGTNGRPRLRGARLPSPGQMLEERGQRLQLKIYGRHDRVRVVDTVAHVYAAPQRRLRVVAVEPLSGGRPQQAFYSTCHQATATQVLTWYAQRWSIEVTFHDSKQHMGFEQPQGWTRRAVQRTAPVVMLLHGLIVVWYVQEGHRHYRALPRPWYTTKKHESFADMLATLRRVSIREQVLSYDLAGPGSEKVLKALENALTLAA